MWTFIIDNQTAGPNANDPGIAVTSEVRSSLDGATQSGLTEQVFQAASPLDPPVLLTVPNTHPKQVQKSFKESRDCGGSKYYLIKISHPAYTYTVPGSPPATINVPAAQYYSIIELACGSGC
ncbi:MAG: hypothetical protein KF830_15105 [Planctomycetes bacterium]|nr:hypothetical protein [Planctomycetota bacterium]